ncbi:ATP-binding cassette domain-containing protein [Micromonospora sp. DT201]|uniref:ATP-binding cassette domain-containing protein n=1 Tax=Micromonospora sp. DT201 TaxID=3393442 RepID=UPI003CEEF3C0
MDTPIIEAVDVTKSFGETKALQGISLSVGEGSILGLLGHNGAGKTTLVNVLTTLVRPTSGSARIAGYDVVREGERVRERIGLTGQFASVDEHLSGRANLVILGRLLGLGRRAAGVRADELLAAFELTEAAGRPARDYSGGMRRRLDLAASIIGEPAVVFLDEPTTGLDPVSRRSVWDLVENLARAGTTVLLTTQYLEEADRLASSISVLSQGRVIASGSASELKAAVGQRTASITFARSEDGSLVLRMLERAGIQASLDEDRPVVTAPVNASSQLAIVVRAMDEAGVEIEELTFAEPTLDDAYIALNRHPVATNA